MLVFTCLAGHVAKSQIRIVDMISHMNSKIQIAQNNIKVSHEVHEKLSTKISVDQRQLSLGSLKPLSQGVLDPLKLTLAFLDDVSLQTLEPWKVWNFVA